jgi:hypothetical protein
MKKPEDQDWSPGGTEVLRKRTGSVILDGSFLTDPNNWDAIFEAIGRGYVVTYAIADLTKVADGPTQLGRRVSSGFTWRRQREGGGTRGEPLRLWRNAR